MIKLRCVAGFGWLNDPLLTEVQVILDAIQNKSANGTAIAWTTAVPGASVNWTSIDDVRRRKNPDVFKTGKKNPNQVSDVGGFFLLGDFLRELPMEIMYLYPTYGRFCRIKLVMFTVCTVLNRKGES